MYNYNDSFKLKVTAFLINFVSWFAELWLIQLRVVEMDWITWFVLIVFTLSLILTASTFVKGRQ